MAKGKARDRNRTRPLFSKKLNATPRDAHRGGLNRLSRMKADNPKAYRVNPAGGKNVMAPLHPQSAAMEAKAEPKNCVS